jgi:hypothetical protein
VATPFDNSLRYPTRSNPQGLVYSFPVPERVYRRRINRLALHRLLESLGEEAISDIHLLFACCYRAICSWSKGWIEEGQTGETETILPLSPR